MAELDSLALDMAIEALRQAPQRRQARREPACLATAARGGLRRYFANSAGKGEPLKSMATRPSIADQGLAGTPSSNGWCVCKVLKAARWPMGPWSCLPRPGPRRGYASAKAARRGLDFGPDRPRARPAHPPRGPPGCSTSWRAAPNTCCLTRPGYRAEQWDIVRARRRVSRAPAPAQSRAASSRSASPNSRYIRSGRGAGSLLTRPALMRSGLGAARDFSQVDLLVSYRSTPQVWLCRRGVRHAGGDRGAGPGRGRRPTGGTPCIRPPREHSGQVDIVALREAQDGVESGGVVGAAGRRAAASGAKLLARRIAGEIAG